MPCCCGCCFPVAVFFLERLLVLFLLGAKAWKTAHPLYPSFDLCLLSSLTHTNSHSAPLLCTLFFPTSLSVFFLFYPSSRSPHLSKHPSLCLFSYPKAPPDMQAFPSSPGSSFSSSSGATYSPSAAPPAPPPQKPTNPFTVILLTATPGQHILFTSFTLSPKQLHTTSNPQSLKIQQKHNLFYHSFEGTNKKRHPQTAFKTGSQLTLSSSVPLSLSLYLFLCLSESVSMCARARVCRQEDVQKKGFQPQHLCE